jgi:hypothetical protein
METVKKRLSQGIVNKTRHRRIAGFGAGDSNKLGRSWKAQVFSLEKRNNLCEKSLIHIVICGLVPRVLREHAVGRARVHVWRLDVLLMYAVPLADGRRASGRRHVVAPLR